MFRYPRDTGTPVFITLFKEKKYNFPQLYSGNMF